jgi:hypothetical protein
MLTPEDRQGDRALRMRIGAWIIAANVLLYIVAVVRFGVSTTLASAVAASLLHVVPRTAECATMLPTAANSDTFTYLGC